jgi:plastocyanin
LAIRFSWRIAPLAGVVVAAVVFAGAAMHPQGELSTNGGSVVAKRAAKTWTIEMKSDGGQNRFEPASLTIQVGDTVRFVDVSGMHNVQFWPDSIPQAAVPVLARVMGNDELASDRLEVGQEVKIVFSDVPEGMYKFFCEPHLRRGQKGAITVR